MSNTLEAFERNKSGVVILDRFDNMKTTIPVEYAIKLSQILNIKHLEKVLPHSTN